MQHIDWKTASATAKVAICQSISPHCVGELTWRMIVVTRISLNSMKRCTGNQNKAWNELKSQPMSLDSLESLDLSG